MKKLLLSVAFICAAITGVNAQTTVFSEDFNGGAMPTGWTLDDADGDGINWTVVQIQDQNGAPSSVYPTPVLRSASWQQAALTPNNWVFTPVIDLSSYSGETLTLKWKVSAADADYDAEKYSVYVSNTNTAAAMLASSTSFTENTLDGVNVLTQRTLDISAFAGQSSVYIAFRHYDVSDEFTMEIDDIEVVIGTVSSAEFFTENFNIYPNPVTDVLNIESKNGLNASEIKITDMTGKVVKVQKDATSINVSNLSAGTYLIDITTNEGKATSKFIKK